MDLETIPVISEELSNEFHSMNDEFTSYCDEQGGAFESPDHPNVSTTVDLDLSAEDQIDDFFFDKEPCCTLGSNKSACWTWAGREKFLQMRLESQELDKMEGGVAVLASLRVMRSIASTSCEGSWSSIKYQFGGI